MARGWIVVALAWLGVAVIVGLGFGQLVRFGRSNDGPDQPGERDDE